MSPREALRRRRVRLRRARWRPWLREWKNAVRVALAVRAFYAETWVQCECSSCGWRVRVSEKLWAEQGWRGRCLACHAPLVAVEAS